MSQFDLVLEDFWSQQSFVKTESGEYLFNLPSTDIVFKLETAEQKEELSNKLSKYFFRDNVIAIIGFLFGSPFGIPIDSLTLIFLIMNWQCQFKSWPGLYRHFAKELASSPRGSFTQFKLLKAKGSQSKLKSSYLTACFFTIMFFILFTCSISSAVPVFLLEIHAELQWIMSISLVYFAYFSGLTAWRLRSVLTELESTQ